MAEGEIEAKWQAQYEQLTKDMVEWRQAHPRATFNEIEAAMDQYLNRLRAAMMTDMAEAAAVTAEAEPVCAACGQRAVLRGKKRRRLRTQGGEEVELERHHASCPHCGTAFFPP